MTSIEELLQNHPELGGLWEAGAGYEARPHELGDGVRVAWAPHHLLVEVGGEAGAIRTDETIYADPVPAPLPPAVDRTDLVKAMDVSSHQPRDLTALIQTHQVEHVVVKLYQTIENIHQSYSLDQLASAQANGCSVGGYVWLYRGVDVQQQIGDALDLAERAGVALPLLWVDLELYEGTWPTVLEALDAVEAIERRGYRAGIYTGNWFIRDYWKPTGGMGELTWRYVWLADYNGREDLDTPSPYWPTGMVLGHQYQGSPIDLDVFARAVTVRG